MNLTIIVPAFNEADYLPATLDALKAAAEQMRERSTAEVETVVVDNNSTDETAAVAGTRGAVVVHEPVQGIARARNAGARQAQGDVLVFVDADVFVPSSLLEAVKDAMNDPACVGGGVDVEYQPRRRSMRFYLGAWRLLARRMDLVQGATQFCRREVFEAVGGYDEQAWIGEDVDFYRSLKRFARANGGTVRFIHQPRVQASARRFDEWPLWKTLLWTNPLYIALFRRRKAFWPGWYRRPVR
ncbi:MAG: glycosyltransferase [Chloroflexota bacterium]|nr:glycosyltransferase [Chloroflexota bacterium]MDE2885590.1 glycosyltransferase [Chloroflexota bacterium]